MNVLITGSKGFVGSNLIIRLREQKDINIFTFDKDDNLDEIFSNNVRYDFVFHLAGSNRPVENKEFYTVNEDLTKILINKMEDESQKGIILFTSSIQAIKDNDYGVSKKRAEDALNDYSEQSFVIRLHNVFGKWCRPNYNSVIATFCHNIARDIEISVNDSTAELELVYIDDVITEFINILQTKNPSKKDGNICYIPTTYKKTLGEITELLYSFRENMRSNWVPKSGDEFIKKLFSTYLSYVPLEELSVPLVTHRDDRGLFSEIVKTKDSGQVSISISNKGVVRGNHYHNTKMERFSVIKGSAKVTFRHVLTNETKEYFLSGDKLEVLNIPVGFTHKIENTSDEEMILLLWCNEIFEPSRPDTIVEEV